MPNIMLRSSPGKFRICRSRIGRLVVHLGVQKCNCVICAPVNEPGRKDCTCFPHCLRREAEIGRTFRMVYLAQVYQVYADHYCIEAAIYSIVLGRDWDLSGNRNDQRWCWPSEIMVLTACARHSSVTAGSTPREASAII